MRTMGIYFINEKFSMNRSYLIWILLAVAVVAVLVFFMFAGTRTPADTSEEIEDQASEAASESADAFNQSVVRAEVATELTALRVRAEAGETYDELVADLTEARQELERSYVNVQGSAAEEWDEIRSEFDRIEAAGRSNASDFLDSLSSLIARLSAEVEVETEIE